MENPLSGARSCIEALRIGLLYRQQPGERELEFYQRIKEFTDDYERLHPRVQGRLSTVKLQKILFISGVSVLTSSFQDDSSLLYIVKSDMFDVHSMLNLTIWEKTHRFRDSTFNSPKTISLLVHHVLQEHSRFVTTEVTNAEMPTMHKFISIVQNAATEPEVLADYFKNNAAFYNINQIYIRISE